MKLQRARARSDEGRARAETRGESSSAVHNASKGSAPAIHLHASLQTAFASHVLPDACLQNRDAKRWSCGGLCISSCPHLRAAHDELGARGHARSGSRAFVSGPERLSVPSIASNACAVQPQRATCVPKCLCSVFHISSETLNTLRNLRISQLSRPSILPLGGV